MESTATASMSVVVIYEKYVAVDLIGVSVSTTTSKLLLSACKRLESAATVTLKYCPVRVVIEFIVEESVVASRKPGSSYSATFTI